VKKVWERRSHAFPTHYTPVGNTVKTRGATRLDGVRGQKQVWRSHVRTWGLPEACAVLKKALVTLLGLFIAPRSHSAPP